MADRRRRALESALLVGAMRFFAAFVHEGAWGIAGPFPVLLDASGVVAIRASGLAASSPATGWQRELTGVAFVSSPARRRAA
jgi:hypothetical protein